MLPLFRYLLLYIMLHMLAITNALVWLCGSKQIPCHRILQYLTYFNISPIVYIFLVRIFVALFI